MLTYLLCLLCFIIILLYLFIYYIIILILIIILIMLIMLYYYASNLPLSFFWYSSLGSHVPSLPKTCNNFAKRVVRIMTSSDLRSHSEPLLKSLRLLKFSDIIHLEILSFVYQWHYKLSPSVLLIILTQYLLFIQF